jgi:hypothetical protein
MWIEVMAPRKSKKAFKRTEAEKIARKANYAREAKSCAKTKAFKRLSESVDVKLKREQSKFGEAIPLREGVEKGTLVKALKMSCMPFLEGVRLKHKSFVSPLITHPHSWITKLMLQSFDDYGELAENNHEREVILEARALFEGMKCIVFISTFENLPTNCTHK